MPFDGIDEKLKRANENIRNLDAEIGQFFNAGKYPVLPDIQSELFLEAVNYHRSRTIPLRLSVLAGEVIHHLRSSLDHVVWLLSTPAYRRKCPKMIEFPIYESRPVNEKKLAGFNGKIEGIASPSTKSMIERIQPYNTPDPIESPLLIVHKMDIVDKHQELVLCFSTGLIELPMEVIPVRFRNKRRPLTELYAELGPEIKQHGKVTPQIAFREFGRRPIQPVIPGLEELTQAVKLVILAFDMLK
jgi:hypothetical protein